MISSGYTTLFSYNPGRLARHDLGHHFLDSSIPTCTAAPGTAQPRDPCTPTERLPPGSAGPRGAGSGSLPDELRKSNWFSEAHLSQNSYTFALQETDANFRRNESRRQPVAHVMAPACRTPAGKSVRNAYFALPAFALPTKVLHLCYANKPHLLCLSSFLVIHKRGNLQGAGQLTSQNGSIPRCKCTTWHLQRL